MKPSAILELTWPFALSKVRTTIPTIGMVVETLEIRGKMNITTMVALDVGGRDKIRPLWRHYYQNVDALVFVVDSNDRERLEDVRQELDKLLREDDLLDKPILVFANKQDLPNCLRVPELTDKLGLHNIRHRRWYIQESVATEGKGVYEGMEWLSSELNRDRRSDSAMCSAPASRGLPAKGVVAKPEHPDDVSTADTEDAIARAEVITSHP